MIRTSLLTGLAALALAAIAGSTVAQAQMTPQQAYEARVAQMRTFGGTMGGLSSGSLTDKAAGAKVFADGFAGLADLFPEGSNVEGSRALPAIWEKWPEVEAIIGEGKAAAAALEVAVAGPDDAFKAALGAVGAVCGKCHGAFRAP